MRAEVRRSHAVVDRLERGRAPSVNSVPCALNRGLSITGEVVSPCFVLAPAGGGAAMVPRSTWASVRDAAALDDDSSDCAVMKTLHVSQRRSWGRGRNGPVVKRRYHL
jgi:hypothetical protein